MLRGPGQRWGEAVQAKLSSILILSPSDKAMTKAPEELVRQCPRCKSKYAADNNYCGTDGSLLEVIEPSVSDPAHDKERPIESVRTADKSS